MARTVGQIDARLRAFLKPRWRHPLAHNEWMWEQIDRLLDERLAAAAR
jgi:hypothetical protein